MSTGKLVHESSGQEFSLGFEVVTIGRHRDNVITLEDPQVSRHHAEISMQGGRWVIQDLESANGTFVNGQRVVAPRLLNHGDMVRVGQSSFQVDIAAALSRQDTLVERIPRQALAPTASRGPRRGWTPVLTLLALLAGLVAIAAIAWTVWWFQRQAGSTTAVPSTPAA